MIIAESTEPNNHGFGDVGDRHPQAPEGPRDPGGDPMRDGTRRAAILLALASAVVPAGGLRVEAREAPAHPPRDYPVQPVPFTAVHVDDAFWRPRIEVNRTVTKAPAPVGRVAVRGGARQGRPPPRRSDHPAAAASALPKAARAAHRAGAGRRRGRGRACPQGPRRRRSPRRRRLDRDRRRSGPVASARPPDHDRRCQDGGRLVAPQGRRRRRGKSTGRARAPRRAGHG